MKTTELLDLNHPDRSRDTVYTGFLYLAVGTKMSDS